MYRLLYQPRASKQLRALPLHAQQRLAAGVEALAHWPAHGQDVVPLKGQHGGLWRLRVGDYRAVFDVDETRETVLIITVFHRGRGY